MSKINKIKTLSIFCTTFLFQLIFAQAPIIQWKKSFGGTEFDDAFCIEKTLDGGYIVAGQSNSNNGDVTGNHGYGDYWIVKLNNNGSIQWQKSYGGSNYDFINSIQQTSDGGFITAGNSYSKNGDVDGNKGSDDAWIVKLGSTGNIQWKKSIGGSGSDSANSIQQTSDGGYIIAGFSNSNDGDVSGNHGKGDFWIIKLSTTGIIEWQKMLGGSDDDFVSSIKTTSDGGYIAVGQSISNNGNVTGNHGDFDIWAVKLAGNGNIEWQKSIGGSEYEDAYSVQQTTDGGFIIAGYSNSNDGDVSGNHGDFDACIVKLTSNGVIQWQKSIGGNAYEEIGSVICTSDGDYVIAGFSNSNNGDLTQNYGSYDGWIVKLGDNGNLLWQKSFGGSKYDNISSILETADGGYVFAGGSYSNDGDATGNHGNYDYWVVKLDSDKLSTVENYNNKILVENPVRDKFNIQTTETIISLQLYTTDGKLIKISDNKNMSVASLLKGIYLLKIQFKNGKIYTEKIIKD